MNSFAAREVVLAPEAESELAAILDYVAERNPLAAGAMTAKFDELFRKIAIAPKSGPASRRDPTMRRRFLGHYVVHYEVDEANDRVVVLAIIHGERVEHRMRRR